MSLHELAMAAAKLVEEERYFIFPVRANKIPCWRCWRPEGCGRCDGPARAECQWCSHSLKSAVDRPRRAYELFMSHPDAALIGVPTGCSTMLVAISVEASAMAWLARSVGRFSATRVHATPGGGYEFVYRMPLPPVPVVGCPQAPHNRLAPEGVTVTGEGGWLMWPAPSPYEDLTQGYRVAFAAPIAPLPRWIARRVTAPPPRPAAPVASRPPRRGLDVQLDGLRAFVTHSRQRTLGERTRWAGYAAGRLVADSLLPECAAVDWVATAAMEAGLETREALTVARRGVRRGVRVGARRQRGSNLHNRPPHHGHLADTLKQIGCAADGAPYVIGGLISQLNSRFVLTSSFRRPQSPMPFSTRRIAPGGARRKP